MTTEGSTATSFRSRGSYEPVPAPTLTTLSELPRAAHLQVARRKTFELESKSLYEGDGVVVFGLNIRLESVEL
jgi:hypothetical protein